MRKTPAAERPRKWEAVFHHLHAASTAVHSGHLQEAHDEAQEAEEWARRWSKNPHTRAETSLGLILVSTIQHEILNPLGKGEARQARVDGAIRALERVVEREAKLAAIHAAQSHIRSRFNGNKHPSQLVMERAAETALEDIRSKLQRRLRLVS